MCIRSEHSEENFPKSILKMLYGWENASGLVFIKGKNSKKLTQQSIVGWHHT